MLPIAEQKVQRIPLVGIPRPPESAGLLTLNNSCYACGDTLQEADGRMVMYLWKGASGSWGKLPASGPAPLGRSQFSMASVGNSIYIFGGRSTKRRDKVLSGLSAMDVVTRKWRIERISSAEAPSPRYSALLVAFAK